MTPEAQTPLSTRRKLIPPAERAGGPGANQIGAANRGAVHHDAASLQHYQSALQLLQQAKFEKALVAFEKLLGTAPPPLAERCRMYVTACHRELSKSKLVFASPEEQYDYAVSLLNTDYYEEAREQFLDILRAHPAADYALYGLAVLDAITGQVEECLEHLSGAIESNPRNRLQARTDTDFQSMQDDPRFTELLYPET
jgi:tetratricopeptide (TPR) repeat protein